MYHNYLIHSSAKEHLDCFHVLAIVNGAAMNIRVQVWFSIVISSGYMPSSAMPKNAQTTAQLHSPHTLVK